MKVFVTGGTGYVGSQVIKQLITEGNIVHGLCRSDASEDIVKELGAVPIRGSLTSIDTLKDQAKECDAVIHLAFATDFKDPVLALSEERAAVDAMCGVLEGTNKPFIFTSGVLVLTQDMGSPPADELFSNFNVGPPFNMKVDTERAVVAFKEKGVRSMVIRLSAVHDASKTSYNELWVGPSKMLGFVPTFYGGEQVSGAIHRSDAAKLFTLALEKGTAGSIYHGVSESTKMKEIAGALAESTGLKVHDFSESDVPESLAMVAFLLSINAPVSAELTKKELGWTPSAPTLFQSIGNQRF